MNAADWVSLALVCVLGAASPGPSLAVILAATRRRGRRGGLLAAIGHGTGVFIYALIAATSLSIVLTHHADLFFAVQLAGAIVLLGIGVRLVLGALRAAPAGPVETSSAAMSRSFLDGFLIAIFNPKIAAFFASLFSQFITDGQRLQLHAAMASLAGAIDTSIYVVIVMLASTRFVHQMLTKYGYVNDLILGAVLCLLGGALLGQNAFQLFA
jgi:threonine/homoserine/homoserine lactone efflux protein